MKGGLLDILKISVCNIRTEYTFSKVIISEWLVSVRKMKLSGYLRK